MNDDSDTRLYVRMNHHFLPSVAPSSERAWSAFFPQISLDSVDLICVRQFLFILFISIFSCFDIENKNYYSFIAYFIEKAIIADSKSIHVFIFAF